MSNEEAESTIRVYVDMVGDLFHAGHVSLLKAARARGDYLVVGVLSDEVALSYKRLPIMNLQERVAVIEACRYVDEIIVAAPEVVTSDFMAAHQISVVVHGDDLSESAISTVYGDVAAAGKLQLVQRATSVSTSEVIDRIRSRSDMQLQKK